MIGWNPLRTAAVGKRSRPVIHSQAILAVAVVFASFLFASALFAQDVLVGQLEVIYGDPHPDSRIPAVRLLSVVEDNGATTEIHVSEELLAAAGGFFSWNGHRVRVTLRAPENELAGLNLRPGTRQAAALTLIGGGDTPDGGVSGSNPWISILCKFSDKSAEPENLAYFQGMYSNNPGGLDHYWREVSYNNIDIVGSTAVDWVTLPDNHTSYVSTPGSGSDADLGALFNDCTAAADPFVDFSNGGQGGFSGINMMFNDLLDCCAWGGGRFASLDGVSKVWRTTWNPPWSFANSAVIAHEMGHGFGLPHANNWDGDSSPYDSPWDVMSAAQSQHSMQDPTYGNLGQHINMYHKMQLQWIASPRLLEVNDGENATVTIDASALASTSNYRTARLPFAGSNQYYTVEVRKRMGNYDGNLPGNVVIIHHVVPGRSEPSWAYDAAVPPANFGNNEGTMWRVGETFTDAAEGISVSIDSETTNGFVVTITRGVEAILEFKQGFE